jgi:hypothetical protein
MNISKEQEKIIKDLELNNVIVDSVAGSGKTTTSIYIAKKYINYNILLLTYNAKLKLETRQKAIQNSVFNLEIHTYHSFCVKYYDSNCFTDSMIKSILINKNISKKIFNYDLIIIDEAQDINYLYYELICKIFKENQNQNTKIAIFGDIKQSIYAFNNADERFIEFYDKLFNFNSIIWIKNKLSTSFRITKEMSLFINQCLLNNDRIYSNKISNIKPKYKICNCFKAKNTLEEIKYYINLGYQPQDFFILAPSIKNINSPIRILENEIKKTCPDILIYVPISEDEKLDLELLENKMVFSTFHQVKGLERKIVFVFHFDNSYFQYYNKNIKNTCCPNELYVATTRALDHLILFHHYENNYLPFLNINNLNIYSDLKGLNKLNIKNNKSKEKKHEIAVTDLFRHLPQDVIDDCFRLLKIKSNFDFTIENLNIPLKISNENSIENVSDITGIAIPNFFEYLLNKKMSIYNRLIELDFENIIYNQNNSSLLVSNNVFIKPFHLNSIDLNKINTKELLYISNCWNSFQTGYIFKSYQITNYDWLSEDNFQKCIERLKNLNLSKNSVFEYKLEIMDQSELYDKKLIGIIDCIDFDNHCIYEFKCVQKLKKEHYLQLALYMYLFKLNYEKDKKFILYNILSNKNIEIQCSLDDLKLIINKLIYHKYIMKNYLSNQEFLNFNQNIFNLYF